MAEEIRESSDYRPGEPGLEKTDDKTLPILSKTQLKKLKKKEKWQRVKAEKRKKEKERAKARKRELREKGELGPTRKQLRHNTMKKSDCRIQVAVDCGFDEYMSEKDIKMLVKQIQFSYSANRRAASPLQFYCCGISGKTKERLESLGDYKGWDINFQEESYEEMFDKSSIVYLSSESPNILQTLEENKVYVIGGLVDHNHQKGLCHRLAKEKGLHHAQLPIAEFLDMKTRKVLTITHVFEILLHYTETKNWQKAFYTVLPPRKGAILKTVKDEGNKDPEKECDDSSNEDSDSSDDKIGIEQEAVTDNIDTDKTPEKSNVLMQESLCHQVTEDIKTSDISEDMDKSDVLEHQTLSDSSTNIKDTGGSDMLMKKKHLTEGGKERTKDMSDLIVEKKRIGEVDSDRTDYIDNSSISKAQVISNSAVR